MTHLGGLINFVQLLGGVNHTLGQLLHSTLVNFEVTLGSDFCNFGATLGTIEKDIFNFPANFESDFDLPSIALDLNLSELIQF